MQIIYCCLENCPRAATLDDNIYVTVIVGQESGRSSAGASGSGYLTGYSRVTGQGGSHLKLSRGVDAPHILTVFAGTFISSHVAFSLAADSMAGGFSPNQ